VVQLNIDGNSGRVRYADAGREIDWPPLAHGRHGARVQRLHVLLIVAGLLFIAPFVDPRRPFRMLHLDLLVLLALGVSFGFAEAGRVYVSTPLMYPPLIYLGVRMVMLALEPRREPVGRLTWAGPRLLAWGLLALLVARYAWTLADGIVNDIGYASAFGADSILNGFPLYDSSPGSPHLDAYGPAMYLVYVPFTFVIPLQDLSHAHTGAATAASIFFDFATVATLFALGRRLREGAAGTHLGLALAWAFAACPWSVLPIVTGTNDGLIALLVALALLVASSPALRAFVLAVAVTAKFGPLVLAGLFSRVGTERGRRPFLIYSGVFAATCAVIVLAYLPDGGLKEFWDSTIGFQLNRSAPFSLWGLHPSLEPLQVVFQLIAVALAAAAFVLPRERNLERLAAAGAAILIATQLTAVYWYYFYIVWFLPYFLVALFSRSYAGSVRNSGRSSASAVASNSS
jgi:hypothetical protein